MYTPIIQIYRCSYPQFCFSFDPREQGGICARDQWGDNYSNLQWGEINIPAWDGQ